MTKEIRRKCTLCGSRHRESFTLIFPSKIVCNDCAYEYRKIFFGYKNRKDRGKKPGGITEEALKEQWWKEIQEYKKNFEAIDGISEDS